MTPDEGLPVVGFDWNGTLCWDQGLTAPEFYEDGARLVQCQYPRFGALQQLRKAACVPVIITGLTEAVRGHVEPQIRQFTRIKDLIIHFQPAWHGYRALTAWKAEKIREAGCHAYVGDRDLDAEAARLAGVMFLHADQFDRHGLFPLFPPKKVMM